MDLYSHRSTLLQYGVGTVTRVFGGFQTKKENGIARSEQSIKEIAFLAKVGKQAESSSCLSIRPTADLDGGCFGLRKVLSIVVDDVGLSLSLSLISLSSLIFFSSSAASLSCLHLDVFPSGIKGLRYRKDICSSIDNTPAYY